MNKALFDLVGLAGYALIKGLLPKGFCPTKDELIEIFLGAEDESILQKSAIDSLNSLKLNGQFWSEILKKCYSPKSKDLVVTELCAVMDAEEWNTYMAKSTLTSDFTVWQLDKIKDISRPLDFWWTVYGFFPRYRDNEIKTAREITYRNILSLSKTQDDWLKVLREKISSSKEDELKIITELLDLNVTFTDQLQLFIAVKPIISNMGITVLKAMSVIGTFDEWKSFVENASGDAVVSKDRFTGIKNTAEKAQTLEEWAFVFKSATMRSDSWEKARKALAELSK